METNQVTEHLQVIRTLMERSALYRRALAPIMIFCGTVGSIAGLVGWLIKIQSHGLFVLFWNIVAAVALTGSFSLVRRQALKDAEPFWSAPTKRVAQAMLPPLAIGLFLNLNFWLAGLEASYFLLVSWTCLYGCALHSSGFCISRGFRLFGWIFIISGCALMAARGRATIFTTMDPNLLMGLSFGGLHLAYGIYLYFTENRKTAP